MVSHLGEEKGSYVKKRRREKGREKGREEEEEEEEERYELYGWLYFVW